MMETTKVKTQMTDLGENICSTSKIGEYSYFRRIACFGLLGASHWGLLSSDLKIQQ